MTKWLMLMVGILIMTAVARADEGQSAPSSCEKYLVEKPYTEPAIAQQICERFPMSTVGCAMDMVDMGMESDIFEAIEYCAAPIVRR